jgi:hypothetical protein
MNASYTLMKFFIEYSSANQKNKKIKKIKKWKGCGNFEVYFAL